MSETITLFVYGTLMSDGCLRSVTGYEGDYDIQMATLYNYERRAVSNAGFPAIFPSEGQAVHGFLVTGIPQEYLKEFDRYEGEGSLYHRKEVAVKVTNQDQCVDCYTYVWAGNVSELELTDWEGVRK